MVYLDSFLSPLLTGIFIFSFQGFGESRITKEVLFFGLVYDQRASVPTSTSPVPNLFFDIIWDVIKESIISNSSNLNWKVFRGVYDRWLL